MKSNVLLIILILFLTFLSCSDNEEETIERLNSFQMTLNDGLWQPSIIDNDMCQETFRCEQSTVDDKIFYTIRAYRDPQSSASPESENIFRLQVMNVNDAGIFPISGVYGDFTNYVRYINNENGGQKIYQNDTHNSSIVEILELIPIEGSVLTGIRGIFSGTLYNINDQNDSIVVDNCEFTFKRLNWNDFCQCSMN